MQIPGRRLLAFSDPIPKGHAPADGEDSTALVVARHLLVVASPRGPAVKPPSIAFGNDGLAYKSNTNQRLRLIGRRHLTVKHFCRHRPAILIAGDEHTLITL